MVIKMNERRIHEVFRASILLKGALAVIECMGGIGLALIGTRTIANLANALTQEELIEDPNDFVAKHLLSWRRISRLKRSTSTHSIC
jgi:uncharacterized membrane protein